MKIHVIDGGCTTIEGLRQRMEMFLSISGPGKVSRHPEGVLVVHDDGYTVLVRLDAAQPEGK